MYYKSWTKELWSKCEYCDQKFGARCTTIHEEKKYDLNVNIVIKYSLIDVPAKQVLSSDWIIKSF